MNDSKSLTSTQKITLSGLFLALALLLPLLTGQIPQIGSALCPMHIPVLLCGFICGWPYGLAVGLISPILRSLIFTMPPLFPVAIAMTFELGTYGCVAGLLFKKLNKNYAHILMCLLGAMICGRIVWGLAMYIISLLTTVKFSFSIFIAGAVVNAIPGIILQIVLLPVLVSLVKRSRRKTVC